MRGTRGSTLAEDAPAYLLKILFYWSFVDYRADIPFMICIQTEKADSSPQKHTGGVVPLAVRDDIIALCPKYIPSFGVWSTEASWSFKCSIDESLVQGLSSHFIISYTFHHTHLKIYQTHNLRRKYAIDWPDDT